MLITILNSNREVVTVLDVYISLIWTERYYEAGDFELHLPWNDISAEGARKDYFVVIPDSNRVMIIEDVRYLVSTSNERTIVLKGSSVERLLDGRVILEDLDLIDINFQNMVLALLSVNVIAPENDKRWLVGWESSVSSDPAVDKVALTGQYPKQSLYEFINNGCALNNIGFKVETNVNRAFVFSLYAGVNRSQEQTELPQVIFSEEYDNIYRGSYYVATAGAKTIALVTTEDPVLMEEDIWTWEGDNSREPAPEPSGLERREMVVDGSRISRTDEDDTEYTDDEMRDFLRNDGRTALGETKHINMLDGEVLSTTYKYGRDYFIGDVVQYVLDRWSATARIVEVIRSYSTQEIKTYVSFEFNN